MQQDLPANGKFKGEHQLTKPTLDLNGLTEQFVDYLSENIKTRFPSNDILRSFSVLGMKSQTNLSQDELEDYGNKELEVLFDHYGQSQTVTWKENGTRKENTRDAVIDRKETLREWNVVKKVVLAEQYPRYSTNGFWSLILKYHDEFPNLKLDLQ